MVAGNGKGMGMGVGIGIGIVLILPNTCVVNALNQSKAIAITYYLMKLIRRNKLVGCRKLGLGFSLWGSLGSLGCG